MPGKPLDSVRRLRWFKEARFGMFVHWGLYSLIGRHAWVMNTEHMAIDEYEKLAKQWRPRPDAPREWARLARNAGMRYMVLTTKHHDGFRIDLAPGEVFDAPPGFVGAYAGDVDDAGNSLRRYLFRYNMPEVVRDDPTYPKVQWNAFMATGKSPCGWDSVESKYYPLVDQIRALGFEDVMLDVGWWKGETSAPEPDADPVDWPSGMAKAAEYTPGACFNMMFFWHSDRTRAFLAGASG